MHKLFSEAKHYLWIGGGLLLTAYAVTRLVPRVANFALTPGGPLIPSNPLYTFDPRQLADSFTGSPVAATPANQVASGVDAIIGAIS